MASRENADRRDPAGRSPSAGGDRAAPGAAAPLNSQLSTLNSWLDDRTGYRRFLHALVLLNFPVSRPVRWRLVWGSSLALGFLVQLVTGVLLMTVYSPSSASAWGSVHYLQHQVTLGWLVRGLHHYLSHLMMFLLVLHLALVVLTAAYRAPKEFIYWTGLILMLLVVALAVTGNPLPWDQHGYWAYSIETGILGTMPLIGPALRTLAIGGPDFGTLTLTRLYTLHVVVLPAILVLVLVIHIALMRRQALRLQESPAATEPYWPHQLARNLFVFAGVLALAVALVLLMPPLHARLAGDSPDQPLYAVPVRDITLEAPADPDLPYPARPEWYFRSLYELRHRLGKDREILATAALPLVLGAFLLLMPFYHRVLPPRWAHAGVVLILLGGLASAAYLTVSGWLADHRDSAFQRDRRQVLAHAARSLQLASRQGIPPEGAVVLLQHDPQTQGPLLFATHCAHCHRWDGHDGTGKQPSEPPTASDLAGFATQKWTEGFILDPSGPRFLGPAIQAGPELSKSRFVSDMAKWSKENIGPDKDFKPESAAEVAVFLAHQSGRRDAPHLTPDVLKSIEENQFLDCTSCHPFKGQPPQGGPARGPDLTGYGSADWLKGFLKNPAAEKFYAKKNRMPAFAERLTDSQLDLLVRWIRDED